MLNLRFLYRKVKLREYTSIVVVVTLEVRHIGLKVTVRRENNLSADRHDTSHRLQTSELI